MVYSSQAIINPNGLFYMQRKKSCKRTLSKQENRAERKDISGGNSEFRDVMGQSWEVLSSVLSSMSPTIHSALSQSFKLQGKKRNRHMLSGT